jgi:hypothetical protein
MLQCYQTAKDDTCALIKQAEKSLRAGKDSVHFSLPAADTPASVRDENTLFLRRRAKK